MDKENAKNENIDKLYSNVETFDRDENGVVIIPKGNEWEED